MNSYISIVTINLGCKEQQNLNQNGGRQIEDPQSQSQVQGENLKEIQSQSVNEDSSNIKCVNNCTTNKNVNKNVNLLSNNNVNNNIDTCNKISNINNIQNQNPNLGENFKDILSRKIMLMEYHNMIKNKSSQNPSNCKTNFGNIVSTSSHLNIVNGNVNSGVRPNVSNSNGHSGSTDKELDPFKLTFEDKVNSAQLTPERQHEESDISKLNLDLEHFFNTDNFLN
jgi:hypothetical protein